MAVSGTSEMISGMDPVLKEGTWFFCTVPNGDPRAEVLSQQAWCATREEEGLSLIVSGEVIEDNGLAGEGPMARLQLNVFSSLQGVGLSAAVSSVLAEAGMPCNIVAGYHHDHVFVPQDRATEALRLLRLRAKNETEA